MKATPAFLQVADGIAAEAAVKGAAAAVEGYLATYISRGHVEHVGEGCPMPALAAEVSRGSEPLRKAFSEGFGMVTDAIAEGLTDAPEARRAEAIRRLALAAGAVLIARAADADTAAEILAACTPPRPAGAPALD